MAAKKPIKKKQMRIRTTSGAVLVADYDGLPFKQLYTLWQDVCTKVSAADMFMEVRDFNLLRAVKESGTIDRVYSDNMASPRSPNKGGVEVIRQLDAIAAKDNDLQKTQLPFLKKLIAELKSHTVAESKTNPRNILFSDPIVNTKGHIIRTKKVYGHYRTERYKIWRSSKKDADTGKFESVPKCPSSWYNYKQDTATPPMWQALYAPTASGRGQIIQSKGLLPIIEEYYEAVKNLTYSGTRDKPISITSKSIAKDLFEAFPEVEEEVKSWVREDSPFLRTNLTLYGKQASESLSLIPIKAETAREMEVFESILKVQNLGLDVDTIYIRVTPLQCNRMALMVKDYADRLKNRTYEQSVAVNRRAQSQRAKEEVERRRGKTTTKKK